MMDQWEYHLAATRIMEDKQHTYMGTYRSSGYPLILAGIYSVFGMDNEWPWKITQALLDTLSAAFIFIIMKNIYTKSRAPAWVAYILALLNVFTAGYVGVRLTEVPAVFFLTLTVMLLVLFFRKKDFSIMLLLSFVLAFLPQIRPGFLYFDAGILLVMLYYLLKTSLRLRIKILSVMFIIMAFSIPFLYNLSANYKYYRQYSPMTVDNLFVREFYISLFIDNQDTFPGIPWQVNQIYNEYSGIPTNEQMRKDMADKYWKRAVEEIKSNPKKFIVWRFEKMWYVWEKHTVYPYYNWKEEWTKPLIYWGNIVLILLFIIGFFLWLIRIKKAEWTTGNIWFSLLIPGLVIYISVLHAFSITAERFSLPVYPILFMFTGFGIWYIVDGIYSKFKKLKMTKLK